MLYIDDDILKPSKGSPLSSSKATLQFLVKDLLILTLAEALAAWDLQNSCQLNE